MKPDWKDAPAWAKFLAMDAGDIWFWYEEKPRFSANTLTWIPVPGTRFNTCEGLVLENSLEERPNE